jgi:uncharacterized protein
MAERALTVKKLYRTDLQVGRSAVAGYGVYAQQPIAEGEVIEEAPILLVPFDTNVLGDYQFSWDSENNALALGFASLYNHDPEDPNAEYVCDKKRQVIVIRALHPIKMGEEIFVNYGKSWFEDRGMRPARLTKTEKTMNDYIPHLKDLLLLVIFLTVVFILAR